MSSYIYNLGMLFSETAKRFPDNLAVSTEFEESATYRELDILSNQMAYFLLDAGLGKGVVIGIYHNKSIEAFACMLACLKIGITYVNVDPVQPVDRQLKILRTCEPVALFRSQGFNPDKSLEDQYNFLSYDDPELLANIRHKSEIMPFQNRDVTGGTPAYLMFTSGSTGTPKGVIIRHNSVMNFIDWAANFFCISDSDVISNVNPMYFDNSVFDFFTALFTGACLVPLVEATVKKPRSMINVLKKERVTVWFSVPSLFVFVVKMRALDKGALPDLRKVVFGGEAFPKVILRQFSDLLGDDAKMVNVYGPTECTCICSGHYVTDDDLAEEGYAPLGIIAENIDFAVIGDDESLVKPGETGELYLSGPQLALGYCNNKEETDKSFVFRKIDRFYSDMYYKTGDLVRVNPGNKLLYFSGRKDFQIKRMGYRIEIEEIESTINSIAGVYESACIYLKSESDYVGRLIFYISSSLSTDELASIISKALPAYMQPDRIKHVEVLPKNQNGKVNRAALRELEIQEIAS